VFCHNLLGGFTSDARGGTEYADFYEMGGKNTDGTYGFDSWRPGWQKPVHTLMKENGVSAFFHGHDHFFGKQEKDGVIYQVVPQPSNRNITNVQASEYGYSEGIFLPGRGFLLVTVAPENVKIDYIRTYLPIEEDAIHKNSEVAYSYTVKSGVTGIGQNILSPYSDEISPNSPNPFSSETSIQYRINKTEQVDLKIFNICGKEVATLVSGKQKPGNYTVWFKPAQNNLSHGIYFGRFSSGGFKESIKLIYTKN
jgi:hypothetical protein